MIFVSILGIFCFCAEIVLYVLLLLGAPLGSLAMQGKFRVLPKEAKPAFFVSILTQLLALAFLAQLAPFVPFLFPEILVKIIAGFFALFLGFSGVKSAFSESRNERRIIAPLSMVSSICFWILIILG